VLALRNDDLPPVRNRVAARPRFRLPPSAPEMTDPISRSTSSESTAVLDRKAYQQAAVACVA
jgi:hypothetical protein